LKNAGAPKVIPRFPDEKAALKLVFATMIRAVDRWCCVSISDLPRHQLKLLRVELGLDPPPRQHRDHKTNRRNSAPHDQQAIDLQDAQDLTSGVGAEVSIHFLKLSCDEA
jgi:hypothetical protein